MISGVLHYWLWLVMAELPIMVYLGSQISTSAQFFEFPQIFFDFGIRKWKLQHLSFLLYSLLFTTVCLPSHIWAAKNKLCILSLTFGCSPKKKKKHNHDVCTSWWLLFFFVVERWCWVGHLAINSTLFKYLWLWFSQSHLLLPLVQKIFRSSASMFWLGRKNMSSGREPYTND